MYSFMYLICAVWFGAVGEAATKATSPPSGESRSAQSSMVFAACL